MSETETNGGSGAETQSGNAIDNELADLASLRQTDKRAYFRDEVQARELALIDARNGGTPAASGIPENLKFESAATVADMEARHNAQSMTNSTVTLSNGGELDADLVADWENSGGVDHHLGVAQGAALAVLDAMPAEDQASFRSSFDGLPAGVQTAIYSELALSPDSRHEASDEDVAEFTSSSIGTEMFKEWGHHAHMNLRTINDRLDNIFDRLSPAEEEAANKWINALAPAQKKAILRELTG